MRFLITLPDFVCQELRSAYMSHVHQPGESLPPDDVQIAAAIEALVATFISMEEEHLPSEGTTSPQSVQEDIKRGAISQEEIERYLNQQLDPMPIPPDFELPAEVHEPPADEDGKVSWDYLVQTYNHLPIISELASEPDMQEKILAVRTALTAVPEDLWVTEGVLQTLHRIVNRGRTKTD